MRQQIDQESLPPASGAISPSPRRFSVEVKEGGREILQSLVPDWTRLCNETGDEIFYRPEWIRCYLNAFAPDSAIVAITVWAEDQLRGLLPLVREPVRVSGLPVTRLTIPANLHTFRTGPAICCGDEGNLVLESLWKAMKTVPNWDMFDVSQVLDHSGVDRLFALAAGDGFPVTRKRTSQTLYLRVDGSADTAKPWIPELRSKFRSHLRRTRRQLEEQGKLEIKHFQVADPTALHAFYDLEGSGWKGAEGTAIKCDPRIRQFYDSIAAAAAEHDYLSIDLLELGGKAIAGHLGFNNRGHYCLVKAGYDETFRRYGPGQLLVNEILAQYRERRLHRFDFVGPATWDESRWASQRRTNYRVFIFRNNWYGHLLHTIRISARDSILRIAGKYDDESRPMELKSKPQGSEKEAGAEG
ncbi:MAG TPA: GNAT family N-acetyltransferase [Candidatus Angelobacter sp.]|jgi:CelD/BcsL family acetyltransferase involved in cellulose biosynthesis|nr:GNAT family N-acetyltransferase [Candidatus Angelobacter sp.]